MDIHLPDVYLSAGVLTAAFTGKLLLYWMARKPGAPFNWAYAGPAFWGAVAAITGGSLALPLLSPDASIEARLVAGAVTGWAIVGGPNAQKISKWLVKVFGPKEATQ